MARVDSTIRLTENQSNQTVHLRARTVSVGRALRIGFFSFIVVRLLVIAFASFVELLLNVNLLERGDLFVLALGILAFDWASKSMPRLRALVIGLITLIVGYVLLQIVMPIVNSIPNVNQFQMLSYILAIPVGMRAFVWSQTAKEQTSLLLETVLNLFRNRNAVIGMTIIAGLILMGDFAPFIATHDPIHQYYEEDPAPNRLPPCIPLFGCTAPMHLLGGDQNARDLFSRIVFGARTSLYVGIASVSLAIGVGTMLGLIAGYASGMNRPDYVRVFNWEIYMRGWRRVLWCVGVPVIGVWDKGWLVRGVILFLMLPIGMLGGQQVYSSIQASIVDINPLLNIIISVISFILFAFPGPIAGYAAAVLLTVLINYPDEIIMRFMDVLLAFPSLLLAIVIVTIRGPGLQNALLAISVVSIPAYARLARASTLSVKELEFVAAERALGAKPGRILFGQIFPNTLTPLIVQATLGIGGAVLEAAALSFVGLGAQPPLPEWGQMLSEARSYVFTVPHMVFFPGIAIMITVLGFNLLGDGLRDALDPRINRN